MPSTSQEGKAVKFDKGGEIGRRAWGTRKFSKAVKMRRCSQNRAFPDGHTPFRAHGPNAKNAWALRVPGQSVSKPYCAPHALHMALLIRLTTDKSFTKVSRSFTTRPIFLLDLVGTPFWPASPARKIHPFLANFTGPTNPLLKVPHEAHISARPGWDPFWPISLARQILY